jgi:hypothetical protein
MDHPSPQLLAHCPVCHTAYPASDVRLLGEKGTTRLFHCTCASCGNAVLAVVLENAGAVSSVGLVTDLEIQDALRFQDVRPVSTDECVEVHRALQTQSKAFCRRLLDKKRP